jgi:cation diffusion facilitator CzcD-associated flavoprotein CzcO
VDEHEIAIIGAGPAGVAAAVCLKDIGLRPLLIDGAPDVAASWRGRYDRLKLNTGRQFSHLPGRRYPKGTPVYPSRDQVVEHLDRHARESGIDLRLHTAVDRIDPTDRGWRLATSTGDIDAGQVIVATGHQNVPFIPDTLSRFTGEVLHSSEYRNAKPFEGMRILVIGTGSSGMEIAHDLTTGDADAVYLSVRTPPNILRRTGPGGLPSDILAVLLYRLPPRLADRIANAVRLNIFGDLSEFGLPIPADGAFTRAHRLHVAPTLVDPEVVDAVKDGSIEVVPAAIAFEGSTAILSDGARLAVDAVVAATGYRPGLERMVGHLGVLAPDGSPIAAAPDPAADGLYFQGIVSRPVLIGYVGKQARRMATRIAKDVSAA